MIKGKSIARMPKGPTIRDWRGKYVKVDRVFAMEHPGTPGWPIFVKTADGATWRLEMGSLRPIPPDYLAKLQREGKIKEMPREYAEGGFWEQGCLIGGMSVALLRHERWGGVYANDHVEFWTVERVDRSLADAESGFTACTTFRLRAAAEKAYHQDVVTIQQTALQTKQSATEVKLTFGRGEYTIDGVRRQHQKLFKEIDRQEIAEAKELERADLGTLDPSSFAKLFSAHLKKNT